MLGPSLIIVAYATELYNMINLYDRVVTTGTKEEIQLTQKLENFETEIGIKNVYRQNFTI